MYVLLSITKHATRFPDISSQEKNHI